MLISNFVKTADYVSLSDIQFATAIALDLLGEETAASKVLTLFLDTTETTESSEHPRNVLEKSLREKYGDGIVLGFISTIYDGEYIELRKDSLYGTKKTVTLKSLLQHTSLENVYSKTMQLLAENPTSKLIYIYTKTSMWFKHFKPRAVPVALQGNTDLIIRLNDAFAEESVKQFCDSGAYESSTCTPQYFLLYAYAHWFKDKKTYIQIVNSRSTLRGTSSEDKRSILDKYVEDSDTYADDNVAYGFDNGLDFRNIASKIYQASISLFNHLSSLTAYDDIFSWYKSSLIEEIRRKNKGSLDSMKRYYELVILEEDSYLSNEKKRKRIARYKLCYQFSTILEQGLALEDIYDFYLHIADAAGKVQFDDVYVDLSCIRDASAGASIKTINDVAEIQSVNGAVYNLSFHDVYLESHEISNYEKIEDGSHSFYDFQYDVNYVSAPTNDTTVLTFDAFNNNAMVGSPIMEVYSDQDGTKLYDEYDVERLLYSDSSKTGSYVVRFPLALNCGETATVSTNRLIPSSTKDRPTYIRIVVKFPAEIKARSFEEVRAFSGRYLVYQIPLGVRVLQEEPR